MVNVTGQNIPGGYLSAYISSLQQQTFWKAGSIYGITLYGAGLYGSPGLTYIRERYPFRLPHMQS